MQNGPFNQIIAQCFGIDPSLVKQISRALRESSMLTTGARGVNAPHMIPLDAARVMIAVLAGSVPTTAVEDVRLWGSFQIDGPILLATEGLKPGPFRATDPDEDCTLLEALTTIFAAYGDSAVLDAHVWDSAEGAMETTLSVTLSERPRSVTIIESGAEFVFSDLQNSKAMRGAYADQTAALAKFKAAAALGDLVAMERAECDIASASQVLNAVSSRMVGNKTGVRVARTLMQGEIIPVALALKSEPTDVGVMEC